jgi:hypothetical protein
MSPYLSQQLTITTALSFHSSRFHGSCMLVNRIWQLQALRSIGTLWCAVKGNPGTENQLLTVHPSSDNCNRSLVSYIVAIFYSDWWLCRYWSLELRWWRLNSSRVYRSMHRLFTNTRSIIVSLFGVPLSIVICFLQHRLDIILTQGLHSRTQASQHLDFVARCLFKDWFVA